MGVRRASERDVAERMHERYLNARTRAGEAELLDGWWS
jgi:hypothetical protein